MSLQNPPVIRAQTIRKCIIPANRKVELWDAGHGAYVIVRAETNEGEMLATGPMTLFLQAGDFERTVPTLRQQAEDCTTEELERHAAVGRICHCGTCFCCHALAVVTERKSS